MKLNTLYAFVIGLMLMMTTNIGIQANQESLPTRKAQPISVRTYTLENTQNKDLDSTRPQTQRQNKAYRLRIGDKVRFDLLNPNYKFNAEVIIDNVGTINLEYINWVEVKGLTLEEATKNIKDLYAKDYFVVPNVKLRLVEKAPLRYKILGQVANPGFYEVPPGLEIDLLDAIAIAGGYTRIAGKITFRSPLPNGEEDVLDFKIRDLTKKTSSNIPELRGDETIIVGESFF